MGKEFDIQEYMSNGVKNVVNNAIRATLKNPKESIFMAKFALASKLASDRRFKRRRTFERRPQGWMYPF